MLFYEPVSLGKIVDFSFKLVFSNLKNYFKIFALYYGIILGFTLLFIAALFYGVKSYGFNFNNIDNFPYFLNDSNVTNIIIIGITISVAFIILMTICSIFYTIMTFDVFLKAFLGQVWTLRESFELAKRKFFSTLVLSFLSFFIMLAGILLCCIGIFPLMTLIVFAFPSLLFENLSGTKAISRSVDLVTKDFWVTFGKVMLLFAIIASFSVVYNALTAIAQIFLPFVAKNSELSTQKIVFIVIFMIVFFIINIIYSLFINAFTNAYYVLLYFNQKIKYENFGVEKLTEEIPDPNPNEP